jgi:hypothetical protein
MRRIFFTVVFLSALALSQECTTSVVVNVFDDHLRLDVETLKADDFQARVDKGELKIVNTEQDYSSRLLVLLETDGTKDSKIRDVVDTITTIAKEAPEGKPVAFGVYADRAVFTEDFITDPEKRARQIDEVVEQEASLGKRVAMFDALHQALQMFGEHQPGDTILLVAGPFDDKSHHSPASIEKEFLDSGVRLMAMLRRPLSLTGRENMTSNSHDREKSFFLDFAERTGGAHSEFDPRFFGFAWRGYMLDLKVPGDVQKPQKWSLKLRSTIRSAFKHTKIFYPELLLPCRAATSSSPH